MKEKKNMIISIDKGKPLAKNQYLFKNLKLLSQSGIRDPTILLKGILKIIYSNSFGESLEIKYKIMLSALNFFNWILCWSSYTKTNKRNEKIFIEKEETKLSSVDDLNVHRKSSQIHKKTLKLKSSAKLLKYKITM